MLTEGTTDDAAQAPAPFGQAERTLASVTADSAYDGKPTYAAAQACQPDPPPDVIVPPRVSAVCSTTNSAQQTARYRHIRLMAEKGRMGWQQATGYERRAVAETAIGRYKHLTGPRLRARNWAGQQGEAALAVHALNRMIRTAKPVSVRIT